LSDALLLAQDFLINNQLQDSGWGYTAGTSQAYPEPTCYSLLALADNPSFSKDKPLSWLSGLINQDGQLYLPQDDMPNWATALFIITSIRLDEMPDVRKASIEWLLEWKSQEVENDESDVTPVDSSLVGWSWISNTFSWVQPTSLAMTALKMAGLKTHERVTEGEALLLDRVCLDGGWNFGNPVVYDKKIEPSVMETALAIFALQDAPQAANEIKRGLAVIEQRATDMPSTLSLALGILSNNLFDQSTQKFTQLLIERQETDGSWRQNIWWTALAALALQAADGGDNVFKIA